MSTTHLKTIVFISICVLGVLILGFFGTRGLQTAGSTQTKNETRTEPIFPVSPRVFRKPLSPSQGTLKFFQKSDFYRTIIDNNLFRPLGWTPPRPREPYRLIGTLIPTDANTPKQAILQRTPAGRTYTVTIGETLDNDTKVVDISSKQVTLSTAGVQRSLKLNRSSWLR